MNLTDRTRQPADLSVRQAVLDARQSFLVEAPAGSGKTGLLTARFLRLLATVERPEQVLAITFTIAAVAEMRNRVLNALKSARDGKTPVSDQDKMLRDLAEDVLAHAESRGWRLLDMPTRLNIKTIDALALEIASQVPLLSQLGPSLEPQENAASLYKLAALHTMRVLENRNASPSPDGSPRSYEQLEAEAAWQLLEHRDNNLTQCVALLGEMLGQRDQWSRHFLMNQSELTDEYLNDTLRPQLEQQLRSYIRQGTEQAAAVWQTLEREAAEKLVDLANHAAGCGDAHELIRGLHLKKMPGTAEEDLALWLGLAELLLTQKAEWRAAFDKRQGFIGGIAHAARKQEMKTLITTLGPRINLRDALHSLRCLPPDRYSEEQWTMIKSLFRLLRRADSELRKIFVATGRTDFIELNLAALHALDREKDRRLDSSSQALAVGDDLEHILVDEFQDTSRTQHLLLQRLIGSWKGDSKRTLFFVGDPMQSIYAFRQAEVRLFAKVRDGGLGNIRFVTQALTVNFRSQQSLVDEHNKLFPLIFAPQSEVQFKESVGFIDCRPGDAIRWHFRSDSAEERSGNAQREAVEICDVIEKYRADPDCKIALLLRVKQHGDHVLALLRDRKISYRAVDLEKLCERQEVIDIAALTRALLHPADRIAWLSVLRAPWCGLTLAGLEQLCGLELRKKSPLPCIPDLLIENARLLDGDDAVIAKRAQDILIPALNRRATTRLPQLVFETWQALGGADSVDDEQLVNIQTFFRLLDDLDQRGNPINASTLDDAMEQLFAPPDPTATGQIEVMTIHKAKGLTFDVVIVPGMERVARHDNSAILEWIEEDAVADQSSLFPVGLDLAGQRTNLLISPIAPNDGKKSPIAEWIKTGNRKRSDAELRRLFYVAATRARHYVHFFAAVERDHDGLKNPPATSLLGAAWNAVAPIAQRQLDSQPSLTFAIAAQSGVSESKPNLVRRLPANWLPQSSRKEVRSTLPPDSPEASARAVTEANMPDNDDLDHLGTFESSRTIAAGITGRAIGTVVHSFLEQLTHRISGGESFDVASRWVTSRGRNIQTILRMHGTPEPSVQRASRKVVDLIQKTLASATGRWVLAAHLKAGDELRISLPGATNDGDSRLDRVFLAGSEPFLPGASHHWIVDYKTATHGTGSLGEFLQKRQQAYGPKMLAYAHALRALQGDRLPIICALYYVAIDRLEIVARLDP